MTQTTAQPTAGVDFLLPGRWWHLSLGTEDEVEREARTMVAAVLGRRDDQAQLRHDVRQSVVSAARSALTAGASDFYFALEVTPGVAIPATLAVYRPEIPFGLSVAGGARLAADSLAITLSRQDGGSGVHAWGDESIALVRLEKSVSGPGLSGGDTEARQLVVSYWVVRRGSERPLVLSFTSLLASMRVELVELFDAIVSTLEWWEPTDDKEPRALQE